ncbi:hypothetical protein [Bacillus sp. FJAT-49736]|uniref:hypothetical protein n=1 Tax=Bacillus sp. FJAT-49736 TaxID=2833582 RepID=UPI001BC912DE|nr:hypothetical protein [Bacillus sp. FJAT-49736]MBS4174156.1 hypothetical protein [Bacillus sp. FJAT-49736]
MFLKKKKKIIDLMDTVSEMVEVLCKLNNQVSYIKDCLIAMDAIYFQIEKEETQPEVTMRIIRNIQNLLNEFLFNINRINEESVSDLNTQIFLLKNTFQEEVPTKLNVVFFPYKVSMWDSLETIYLAAKEDKDCVTHVVPIPYYQLSQNEAIPTYEGDRFPENISITHYREYNLEEQDPDIIYVHNIYDNYNTLTRVYEQYFTSNLKKYTDMLVYVPYHTPHFMYRNEERRLLGYSSPAVINVDRIILANEMVKEAAIEDGLPEEKLLVLGSPKLDKMVYALNEEITFPIEWGDKIEGKTVYLINTGCLFFANRPFWSMEKLIDIFNIPRYIEESIVIWRPHPLTDISIIKYKPEFYNYYLDLKDRFKNDKNNIYSGVIIDETDNYIPALKAADVLISTDGSLLRSYLLTEKKVMFWDENKWHNSSLPNSVLPSDVFYYTFDNSEPWYELAKKFSNGYDPLEKNRKGMASKIYVNLDGSAGEKIHFAIKKSLVF